MLKKIMNLDSEIQAIAVRDILEVNEIPHVIRSFHDSVYGGLFQHQYGWGILEAEETLEKQILELLKDSISEE